MWKKTPKEEIESVKEPEREHSYIKVPGGMLVDVTTKSKPTKVKTDRKIVEWMYRIRKQKPLMSVHTHPHYAGLGFSAFPSKEDLISLVRNEEIKIEVIAQQDGNTGEVQGYTFLHKKIRDFKRGDIQKRKRLLKNFKHPKRDEDIGRFKKRLEEVTKNVGVDIKYRPARGYYFDAESGSYERKEHEESKTMVILASVGILTSLFFFSFNLTGNAVSNLNTRDGNILGIIFFLAGIVGFFISHIIKK